jgi:hypothetical protein
MARKQPDRRRRLFLSTPIPLAFERALDVKDNYGFNEIVIIIDDLELWNDAWGPVI